MERKLRLNARGTISFLILFGFAVGMWWFFRSYILLAAILVMAGGVNCSAVVLWLAGGRFSVKAILPEGRVGRGSSFPLYLRVENPVRVIGFTADICYRWGNVFTQGFQTRKEHLWIVPGKGIDKKEMLESRFAGRLEVQIEAFRVYDPFRIFCLTGCDRRDASVLCYPDPGLGEESEIYSYVEDFPKENETKKRGTDYNPDYEIREYIPGDELKSIHWKLTAKQNRLMVRERLATGRQKINVVLPLCEDKVQNDQLMDSMYSLCMLLLKKEYPVQLFWTGNAEGLQSRFLAEQGELENVTAVILSGCGRKQTAHVQEQVAVEYPGESYILIQTGAYKGAYIQ